MVATTTSPPTKTMKRRRRNRIDVRALVRHWLQMDDAVTQFQRGKDEDRLVLLDTLKIEGTPEVDPETGRTHYWMRWPDDPVEGRIKAIKAECRQGKKSLNPERTEALLKAKGLWKKCTVTVVEIDEDAVIGQNIDLPGQPAKITDAELRELYDYGDDVWAFVPQRVKL